MHMRPKTFGGDRPFRQIRAISPCLLSLLITVLSGSVSGADTARPHALTNEFQFVRMIYPNYQGGGRRRRGEKWATDAPEAETHFWAAYGVSPMWMPLLKAWRWTHG